ncbi:MAG: sporulation protein YqfD [Oscillospiraceae bacterium]|nr:sporulation protein YqfD [Oscillospiraceae bacterium]
MLSWVIRKLQNTVDFSAYGAECEILLKHAVNSGIDIINPKKKGYVLSGKIIAKKYKKLRIPARKNGIKIKIIKKNGPYFFIKKNRIKIGAASGLIFIYLMILFLNMFIWEINVAGNEKVSENEIILSANESGLKIGTLKSKHDIQNIEWDILTENDNIANVQVNIQGSCANITIREIKEPEEMKPDDDIPINIVASRYGVIRKMNVYDGQDRVAVGDAVMKGELLVSAVYEDRHNKLTLKHARAEIIAETDYVITAEFPLEQIIEKKVGIKAKSYDIEILGLVFHFGNSEKYKELPKETKREKLCFLWIEMPIYLTTTRFFDVKQNTVTYNFEQGRDGAYSLLEEKEKEELFDCEIISRKDTEKVKNNVYIVTAEYVCLMNIAEEQPIESDIPWKNSDDMS